MSKFHSVHMGIDPETMEENMTDEIMRRMALHIEELKDKVKSSYDKGLQTQKIIMQGEITALKMDVEYWKSRCKQLGCDIEKITDILEGKNRDIRRLEAEIESKRKDMK